MRSFSKLEHAWATFVANTAKHVLRGECWANVAESAAAQVAAHIAMRIASVNAAQYLATNFCCTNFPFIKTDAKCTGRHSDGKSPENARQTDIFHACELAVTLPKVDGGPMRLECSMHVLEAIHVWKEYGAAELRVPAVQGVNVSVESGELLAIVGPSGCGKSTLLHMLGGIDVPTRGQVQLEGRNIGSLSDTERSLVRRRRLGFVFQKINVLPTLSAVENVALPLRIDGVSRTVARKEHWRRSTKSASAPVPAICRTNFRAVSSSAWRSPEHSWCSRLCY